MCLSLCGIFKTNVSLPDEILFCSVCNENIFATPDIQEFHSQGFLSSQNSTDCAVTSPCAMSQNRAKPDNWTKIMLVPTTTPKK